MIKEVSGNLLDSQAEAIVNTVNTVGVAGKGIALQFRQAYPGNFRAYERAAKRGDVVPGRMFVWSTGQLQPPHYIVNFPTKRHWRGNSRIADIAAGLEDLIKVIEEYGISSIAVPPLGCGNGGLKWSDVRPLIVEALGGLNAEVLLFPPNGAPEADQMPIRTERPKMTLGRAALLLLLKQYRELDSYRLSALEVQKLAYFLQESGEILRLRYERAPYGPYAENLNHVLIMMEGHYTLGYGDRSREPHIGLVEGADRFASEFLHDHPETMRRLARVSQLVHDWETPYGLELLATVHWALTHAGLGLSGRSAVYDYVASWTPRKAHLFKPSQIDRAMDQLVRHEFASGVVH
ncbi:macro domain-containing protein [Actinoplanes sp. TBRC 11911]|uniref:type II toxin-antitoxin system antitoxin DNA ADP-ribosyl glycohydrolase DarG n=1 Tax=Actinoplanes sp. TBRC 11911 TaxID=2729386 RepID=UPI00145D3FDE|nr:macro domain-containing protein [Actinoplanes sp. TBRC 11911]NMO50678.1 macro domain-containing protein [Actinoplanes sp. TBRC 11911]